MYYHFSRFSRSSGNPEFLLLHESKTKIFLPVENLSILLNSILIEEATACHELPSPA